MTLTFLKYSLRFASYISDSRAAPTILRPLLPKSLVIVSPENAASIQTASTLRPRVAGQRRSHDSP